MTVTSGAASSFLSERIRAELWRRIADRLSDGESLVTRRHYHEAIDAAFLDFAGQPPSADVRRVLRTMVEEIHQEHPETYLVTGMQNAVKRAFANGVDQLAWDVATVERRGSGALKRFLRKDRIRDLLEDIRLDPRLIDVAACVRHGLEVATAVAGGRASAFGHARAGKPRIPPAAPRVPRAAPIGGQQDDASDLDLDPTVMAAVREGQVSAELAQDRVREQKRLQSRLHALEMERLPEALPLLVADGLVEEEEAERYRALRQVDERVAASEIDVTEGETQRGGILDIEGRRDLDRKLREVVEGWVSNLQVFESLQRIRREYDPLLKLLIRHKQHVLSSDANDRTPLATELLQSDSLLELAVSAMERKDPELRLLSLRLPPYGQVAPTKLEPIANLTIEESFVDDLRQLSTDGLAKRMRAPDRTDRARPMADIRCLLLLLDNLMEATPFRRKVRLVIANRALLDLTAEVEALYRKSDSLPAAREVAEQLLRQRLERVFADASPEEELAVRKRGQALMMTIEQKLTAETEAAVDEVLNELGGVEGSPANTEAGDAEWEQGELSEIEKTRGAQVVNLEVRVAGRPKTIPGTVMPDPDDSQRFVMAERDPESGELVPQKRRRRRRYVNRRPDGSWIALTG